MPALSALTHAQYSLRLDNESQESQDGTDSATNSRTHSITVAGRCSIVIDDDEMMRSLLGDVHVSTYM